MMTEDRKDRVEMEGGVVHLPAEFREVARLANRAGLDGFEVADVECGIDVEAFLAMAKAAEPDEGWGKAKLPTPTSRILITYRKAAQAVRMREALQQIFFMDKCPQPGDGCAQCIARAALAETNAQGNTLI